MSNFLIEFRHDGGTYSLLMPAENWADAEAKVRSLRQSARVEGSDVTRISVNAVTLPFAGLLARLIIWLKNLR